MKPDDDDTFTTKQFRIQFALAALGFYCFLAVCLGFMFAITWLTRQYGFVPTVIGILATWAAVNTAVVLRAHHNRNKQP